MMPAKYIPPSVTRRIVGPRRSTFSVGRWVERARHCSCCPAIASPPQAVTSPARGACPPPAPLMPPTLFTPLACRCLRRSARPRAMPAPRTPNSHARRSLRRRARPATRSPRTSPPSWLPRPTTRRTPREALLRCAELRCAQLPRCCTALRCAACLLAFTHTAAAQRRLTGSGHQPQRRRSCPPQHLGGGGPHRPDRHVEDHRHALRQRPGGGPRCAWQGRAGQGIAVNGALGGKVVLKGG